MMAEARRIVERYHVVLSQENEEWYGRGLELPHVFADGATAEACVANTREALATAVAYLLEQGQRPPAAASEGTRTEQVNVRLTAEERLLLESAARRKGFTGMSDFVRSAAIDFACR